MTGEYDTAEIRLCARRIAAAASEVRELGQRDVRRVSENLGTGFKGLAADALNERLGVVGSDIVRISRGLDAVQRELLAFARRLDEADRKVAREIAGK